MGCRLGLQAATKWTVDGVQQDRLHRRLFIPIAMCNTPLRTSAHQNGVFREASYARFGGLTLSRSMFRMHLQGRKRCAEDPGAMSNDRLFQLCVCRVAADPNACWLPSQQLSGSWYDLRSVTAYRDSSHPARARVGSASFSFFQAFTDEVDGGRSFPLSTFKPPSSAWTAHYCLSGAQMARLARHGVLREFPREGLSRRC